MASFRQRPASNSSIWNLPGLEKDAFYAAALYLHAAKGELEGKPLYREPKTPEATRDFLDRLADCFARSKLQDARDHVSATAMVRNEQQKKIMLYVAKNQSTSGSEPFFSQPELGAIANENEAFAKELVDWFNALAGNNDLERYSNIFQMMCEFAWSRLEHYIKRIGESDVEDLERVMLLYLEDKSQEGWKLASPLINKCKLYQKAKSNLTDPINQAPGLLATYAQFAGQVRQHRGFRDLIDEVETSPSDKGIKLRGLAQTVKWINYLGRVYAAYTSFIKFCTNESQIGYSFEYRLLESQDDDWFGDTYLQKIQSWTGELGLTDELKIRKTVDGIKVTEYKTVEALMAEVVKVAANKARVHCEMQLLMHFSQPGVENCLDYFGCSKKSCWLCWQMILQNSKYSMKNTHRKLYPRWAFPFDFSSTEPAIAEGLRVAYVEMLSLIQNKVVRGIPLSSLEPYLQTSARMTRRMSIAKDTDQDIEAGLFSFNPIAAPDSFHCVSLPALHLPVGETPGKIRQVQVYGYEHKTPNKRQYPPFALFNGKAHVFAFQLLTIPKDLQKYSKGTEDQGYFWKDRNFSSVSRGSGMIYRLYYRLADILAPNPCVLSLWRKSYGEDPEFFPWRGDIFILCLPTDSENVAPQSSQIDESDFLESLEALFNRMGPEYARETWDSAIRTAS